MSRDLGGGARQAADRSVGGLAGLAGRALPLWVAGLVVAVVTAPDPARSAMAAPLVAQAGAAACCLASALVAIRARAARVDVVHSDRARRRLQVATRDARDAELRRTARRLHDTVVNTLGAIRGLPISDLEGLRRRCAADLAALDAGEVPAAADVATLVQRLAHRAHLLGVRLETDTGATAAGATYVGLPPRIAAALEGALGEALCNVAKHSGVAHARLVVRWDGVTGTAELADRGRGFRGRQLGAPGAPSADGGGGGAESILARCREAGIEVSCLDRGGAVVRCAWNDDRTGTAAADAPPWPGAEHEALDPLMGHAGGRLATVAAAFGVLVVAATPPGPSRSGALAALAVVVAMVCWMVVVTRVPGTARVPWPVAGILAHAATALPGWGAAGCGWGAWSWWGPVAGITVVACVVLVDARAPSSAAAIVGHMLGLAASALPGQGAVPGACVAAPGAASAMVLSLGVVAALVTFRRTLATHWQEALELRAHAWRAVAAEAERAVHGTVAAPLLARAAAVSRPVLMGIAEGRLDPADPLVRLRCARAEALLRAVITLGAERGRLADELAGVVDLAEEGGVLVRVRIDGPLPTDAALAGDVGARLRSWLAVMPAATRVDLAVLGMSGGGILMASCWPPCTPPSVSGPASIGPDVSGPDLDGGRVAWRVTSDATATTLEVEWSGAQGSASDPGSSSRYPSRRASR